MDLVVSDCIRSKCRFCGIEMFTPVTCKPILEELEICESCLRLGRGDWHTGNAPNVKLKIKES